MKDYGELLVRIDTLDVMVDQLIKRKDELEKQLSAATSRIAELEKVNAELVAALVSLVREADALADVANLNFADNAISKARESLAKAKGPTP